jgi:hypothetical protein
MVRPDGLRDAFNPLLPPFRVTVQSNTVYLPPFIACALGQRHHGDR